MNARTGAAGAALPKASIACADTSPPQDLAAREVGRLVVSNSTV
jgi:hypothetical protein